MEPIEFLASVTPAQAAKAFRCQTPEALLSWAREEGLSLDPEQAAQVFEQITYHNEPVSDEEFDALAGRRRELRPVSDFL